MMVGGYSPLPLLKFLWWRCYALRVAVLRSSCGGATRSGEPRAPIGARSKR